MSLTRAKLAVQTGRNTGHMDGLVQGAAENLGHVSGIKIVWVSDGRHKRIIHNIM